MHERSISALIKSVPYAEAFLKGNRFAPNVGGSVRFYPWADGSIVKAEISNLPEHKPGVRELPQIGPFGFHIHEGGACASGRPNDSFAPAGDFYNTGAVASPEHAGDLPALFSNGGYAYMVVYTNRFKPEDVVGRTVVLHQNPGDYAGTCGNRIACGIIRRMY